MVSHIEDVGEIRLDLHFQQKPHRMCRVVRQVVVLVDAFEDGALETKPDRSFRQNPIRTGVGGGAQVKLRGHELVANSEIPEVLFRHQISAVRTALLNGVFEDAARLDAPGMSPI